MLSQGRLALRDQWQPLMAALTQRMVPTFVFSSGYGDVVTQVSETGRRDEIQRCQRPIIGAIYILTAKPSS